MLDPTRAKPEPWFVGSGTGLMIGVLTLVALLLVARGVTFWWVAEEAWNWWDKSRATPLPAPPPPPAPPARNAFAPAIPARGDPGASFQPDVYPAEAIRKGEQGRVVAELLVDATGKVADCTIQTSSGSVSLDRKTCKLGRKVRYSPARDASGRAVPSYVRLPVRWQLPEERRSGPSQL